MTDLSYTVISHDASIEPSELTATSRDGALWLPPVLFESATGWKVRDVGLCRDDACVPISHLPELRDGHLIDLVGTAALVGAPLVVDDRERIAAIGTAAAIRAAELADDRAPELTLRDLDGRPAPLLNESGDKQMVVAFSSWCGCRYDLPGWQRLHDELSPHGFGVVAVAVDESPDDVRPWVEDLDLPVLLDADRSFCDRYGIVNVPTVVWIDEDRRIVQPNLQAFSDDQFKEFHGKASEPHARALRNWVVDDVAPVPETELEGQR
ncbi:MAG TPA: TlpA disulfide reductase family protein, partial [Microthrixaceae bacterium]|nr:TlpA disulfide reductase family protein [Microthrixaceae bacterium]